MRENQIIYRHAVMDDIKALVKLELDVWGNDMAADKDKWISRINIFSEGTWVAELEKKLVGVIVTHIIKWDYPEDYYPSWEEVTANGYITNHNNNGDTMYGVDLSVLPGIPSVACRLLQTAIQGAHIKELDRGLLGSRMPSLKNKIDGDTTNKVSSEFIKNLARKDPEVRFFIKNGFRIITACKDYFPADKESFGWGIILELV